MSQGTNAGWVAIRARGTLNKLTQKINGRLGRTGLKRTLWQRELDCGLALLRDIEGRSLREIAVEIARTRPYSLSRQQIFKDIRLARAKFLAAEAAGLGGPTPEERRRLDRWLRRHPRIC